MITWWNDNEIEVVEIEGRMIALNGWNGESYTECFEVEEVVDNKAYGVKEDITTSITPIYKEVDEDDYEIVGYEM